MPALQRCLVQYQAQQPQTRCELFYVEPARKPQRERDLRSWSRRRPNYTWGDLGLEVLLEGIGVISRLASRTTALQRSKTAAGSAFGRTRRIGIRETTRLKTSNSLDRIVGSRR